MIEVEATLEEGPRGGAFVSIPPDGIEALGGGGRIRVVATFDGIPYRGSIVRMGGVSVIGVLKEIREALGKGPGDELRVSLQPDLEERVVEIPAELEGLLEANPEARRAFDALSYTHRREHAGYVAEARKAETRQRRATKTIESLLG
ncbi:MAG TPA: YdeI/OmpD-associated family protein [Acidimicrobiia bacterium]|nr:YdeI/OmpD-associated family protein [Acidimicrobiia bacterium]